MFLTIRNALAGVVRNVLYPPEKLREDRNRSAATGESIAAWWERHHVGKTKFWLSGTRPDRAWALLNVDPQPGMRVLDIGVGLGGASKALKRLGCAVDALDISEAALARVERLTERRFTPDSLPLMPTGRYDLAISFLVAQHMSHDALREQLLHVTRALKPDGVFAIQVACPYSGPSHADTLDKQKGGAVLRSPEEFRQLVSSIDGKIVWDKEVGRFEQHKAMWMAFHITRCLHH
jgi:SAM-dependent methyltransferase